MWRGQIKSVIQVPPRRASEVLSLTKVLAFIV